jgi:diaminohydroxyphosphoribosylaminopyrimidine deaminase / 5-amino-6-(5-phosphoribosylamino)uracil reductase
MDVLPDIFMQRALSLAGLGKGNVSPNPLVGCVIAKNGKIVGQGYHREFGGPHAEVYALRMAGPKAKGATAYITLEPCIHFGKTPPCAPQLIKSGIKKAVIAMKDPNPIVSGRGIRALKNAGIEVEVGMGANEAQFINRPYVTWMTKKRPFVLLKMAMTLDGKIATASGDSRWISGEESRRLVHQMRSETDAVLVGTNTVQKDNPLLTSHGWKKNPVRVILDPHLRLSPKSKIFKDKSAPTIVFTAEKTESTQALRLHEMGVQIQNIPLFKKKFNLQIILKRLAKMNMNHVIIEGGGETAWRFLEAKLVDEVAFFIAPKIIGGRNAVPVVGGDGFSKISQGLSLNMISVATVGEDILVRASIGKRS